MQVEDEMRGTGMMIVAGQQAGRAEAGMNPTYLR